MPEQPEHHITVERAPDADHVKIEPAKAGGFMAWARPSGGFWMMVYPHHDANRISDLYRTPPPLFENHEDATAAIRRALPTGGEGRVLHIAL